MLSLVTASLPEMHALCAELGVPVTRADEVLRHVHGRLETDPLRFGGLARRDRQALAGATRAGTLEAVEVHPDPEGDAEKVVYALEPDGVRVEAVLMLPPGRVPALCISTQAGCGMRCSFCATGAAGLTRNLTAAEIVGQVYDLRRRLVARGLPATRHGLLFMGMGEPLANRAGTFEALRILTDKRRFGMSPRRIVVSTIGLIEGIRELATLDLRVVLAISLHAMDPATRAALMPVTGKVPVGELLDAAQAYAAGARRPLVLEYILLPGVNDDLEQARRLGEEGRRRRALVNLIPWNPVPGFPYRRPEPAAVDAFRDAVRATGAMATVRWSKGTQVAAGCGQLAGAGAGRPAAV